MQFLRLPGLLWYQGESNAKDKGAYQPKLESLIRGWRAAWKPGDLPFYCVQLPGIGESPVGPLLYNKAGQPVGPFSTNGYGPERPE